MAEDNPFTPLQKYEWSINPSNEENEKSGQKGTTDGSPGVQAKDVDLWVQQYIDSIPNLDEIDEVYKSTQGNNLEEKEPMKPEVVSKLCDFIGGKIPLEMLDKFQESGNNLPHKIVNLFGGNQQTLIRFIRNNQASIFLIRHPKVTGNLFQMARLMLQQRFDTTDFPPHKWMKMKKTRKFDIKFMKMDHNDIKELCNSGDYTQQVAQYIESMYEQICCSIKKDTLQETTIKDIPRKSEKMDSQDQLEAKKFPQPFRNRFEDIIQPEQQTFTQKPEKGDGTDPMEAYLKSLNTAIHHHTTNEQGRREHRYAAARSPYEEGFQPSFNDNV